MSVIQSINSWVYSLIYIIYLAFVPYIHVTFPNYSVIVVLIGFLLHFLDFLVSESPMKNLQIIHNNFDISNTKLFIYMTINLLIYQSQWLLVGHYILHSVDIKYYFDLPLLLKIAVTMILGDIYFFFSHKALHDTKVGAKLHKLHHCCYYPSLSTNLMFDPIDIIIEFTGIN